MAIDRLLRANRTVLAVPIVDGPTGPLLVSATGVTAPFTAPTVAVLNSWIGITTTTAVGAGNGGNISCALLDDLQLGLADSDSDDELTICSIGNESSPTFYNVDAVLTGLRDKNIADTGVFNLFLQLMNAPDIRYVLVDRIGRASTEAMTIGDDVSLYEVRTDNPVDVKEDRGNLKLQQTPTASGLVNTRYTIAA